MKRSSRKTSGIILAAVAGLAAVAASQQAQAANKYFDTSTAANLQGGAATWDTGTTADWSTATAGSNPLVKWVANDTAFFQTGVANAVTISGTVAATSVTQATNGTATTLSGGTLQINGAAGLVNTGNSLFGIDSAVTLNNAAATNFTFNAGNAITINGAIGQSGNTQSITKSGGGTLTLTGINTYGGSTTVSAGTLALSGASGTALNSSGFVVGSGATLKLDNTSAANNTDRLGDSAGITLNGGTLNFSNNAGAVNYSETVGALALSSNYNSTVTSSQAAVGQTSALTFASLSRSANAGGLNFTGTGLGTDARNQVLITSSPTLSNGIIGAWATVGSADWATYGANGVTACTGYTNAALGGTIADGSANNVRINSGATGNITLGASTTSINTLLQGHTTAATVDTASKTLQTSGLMIGTGKAALTIGAAANDGFLKAASAGGELILSNQSVSALTVNAVIADNTSASSLTTIGSVVLNGNNTYSGATTINVGSALTIGGTTGKLGSGTVANNGTLTFNHSNTATLNTTISGAGTIYVGNAAGVTTTVNQTGGSVSASGFTVANSGGSGVYDLQGGSFNNAAGNVLIGNSTGTGTFINSGGVFTMGYGAFQIGANTGGGTFTQTGGSTTASILRMGKTSTFNMQGGWFLATGCDALAANSGDAVSLTFSGGTATLIGFGVSAYSASATETVTFDGGVLRPYASNATFMRGMTHAYVTANGAKIDTNGFNITIAQALENKAGETGTLTKSGTGTLTLSGANTHSGTTLVSGGTLALGDVNALQNSSLDVGGAGAVAFTVAGTNTYNLGGLKGAGSINAGANTLNLKSLAPGNSPGTISVTGAVTLASDASSSFELASGGVSDHLTATSIALGGTLNLSQSGSFTFAAGQDWDLFDGTLSSSFTSIATPTLAGLKWNTSQLTAGGTGEISLENAASVALSTSGGVGSPDATVSITGSGGKYVSSVENLGGLDKGSVNISSAAGIDTPILVALDLNGTSGDISALLSGLGSANYIILQSGDAAFDTLNSHYGNIFDAVFRYNSSLASGTTGSFTWDFTGSGVTVDHVAVVPEPASLGVLAIGAMGLLSRRRRKGMTLA